MNLDDLRIFRTVVEAGGVTRAAGQLHRVQSNVTTRIRQLEDKLGVPLFIREGRRLHLAPAGQRLLPYARQLLALADEARQAVLDGTPRGPLVLGAMESTAAVRLPGPLGDFMARYPQVQLSLKTGNPGQLMAAVLGGELDAALVPDPPAAGALDHLPMFSEELVIVSRAGQGKLGQRQQAVLVPMVAFEPGCPHRARLEAWYAAHRGMPAHTVQITSYHAMLGCVAVGMGIALVPRSVLATFPERARLAVHALPRGQDQMAIALVWRRGALSPALQALIDALKPASGGRRAASPPADR